MRQRLVTAGTEGQDLPTPGLRTLLIAGTGGQGEADSGGAATERAGGHGLSLAFEGTWADC